MNKVILIGRVTKDIELKKTNSGKSVVSFTLAVNRDYKNAEGSYDADFINCVAFEKRAETISKYVHKGDKFSICGKLNTRTFEKSDGSKGYATEVMVDDFEFLEPKKQATEVKQSEIEFKEVDPFDDLPF